jgi:hypothetical protein
MLLRLGRFLKGICRNHLGQKAEVDVGVQGVGFGAPTSWRPNQFRVFSAASLPFLLFKEVSK